MNDWLQSSGFLGPGLFLLMIWTSAWKGLALWKAVGKRQAFWFVIFLIVNTLGILEILYLFWLARFDLVNNKAVLGFLNEKIGRKVKTA
jgi:hypothetical protein